MNFPDIFINEAGRLRSGWRFFIFAAVYLPVLTVLNASVRVAFMLLPERYAKFLDQSGAGFILQGVLLFTCAALVGWGCGRLLEGLPWRALGWARHRGWLRDWLMGSLIGAASLLLAGGLAAAAGGLRFAPVGAAMLGASLRTLLISGLIFIPAAAGEEFMFRGYPLQTMTRAHFAWVGIILTAFPFALVHVFNPNNVLPVFSFINTALAGVWLGVAFLRTRSLWFPLGVHWSWNWMMGAVLGIPVSGIEEFTPAPLFRGVNLGPDWLTGGPYGLEGGAACTLALCLSTIFIWRTGLLRAEPEMKRLTDEEIPNPERQRLRIYEPPPAA